ncbi:serine/threonine kinase NLK-like [Agrilus planipennis]|uniref:Serine/threonine kinase NLK-like n=1 Tax=Agrilus planipennis TaxID=224129 RepID=A0A7F5REW2_AGRPL|nr:serine/threonine kinase NLK-like [Agrilus planipennis]
MLCFFKHENVLSALDILQPPHIDFFQEMYPFAYNAMITYSIRVTKSVTMLLIYLLRAVTDPRDGRRVALKKLPNVFQSLVSSKRVFRELKMLCFFKHENVLSALDILQPPHIDFFQEMYPFAYNAMITYSIRVTKSVTMLLIYLLR